MKVFISWSGERSMKVAELLDEWLKCVLQALQPWISSKDIDRGAFWFSELTNSLNDSVNGIICLTKENLNKPWILFEAGSLAKGVSVARVCTFLIDIEAKDVTEPLSQFNHTMPTRSGMLSLVKTLNNRLGDHSLSDNVVNNVFDTYWPQFEIKFNKIIIETKNNIEETVERSEQDILSEILYTIRKLDKRILSLEDRQINSTILIDDIDDIKLQKYKVESNNFKRNYIQSEKSNEIEKRISEYIKARSNVSVDISRKELTDLLVKEYPNHNRSYIVQTVSGLLDQVG